MFKTAVVILNWNGVEYLRKFLPFLEKHSSSDDVELVVADNASSDNSLEIMAAEFPQIRVISLEKNHGFAGGYNQALKQVQAKYYMLLNSDIEVTENWLEPLVSLLDNEPDVAACSPVLLDYYRRENYEYAGAAGGYIDKFGFPFCRGRIFDSAEKINDNYSQPCEVFWTTGACMLVRAEAFHKEGGFDDYFFAHMEEIDLCWRWKNSGHKLMVLPSSIVYHIGGGTLPKSNPFKTYLNFRNNLFLLYKNLPDNNLTRILLIRLLLDALSAFRFLVKFAFRDIGAIIKAHRHFFKKRNDYREFRKSRQNIDIVNNHAEQYNRSVVIDYFLLGHKSFDQLRDGFGKTGS